MKRQQEPFGKDFVDQMVDVNKTVVRLSGLVHH